ncbi:MAG: hypothetical protein GF350_10085 [Chitinivibrionales bacterium]|nr:hypothetical protein [Chitinivibrionales bacterium]
MKRFEVPGILGLLFCVAYSVNYTDIVNVSSISNPEELVANRLIPVTVDIRSLGMGKVAAALERGNSVFVNPAVAASLDKTMVSTGVRVHAGLVSDGYSEAAADSYTAMYKPHFKLTHLGGVVPFKLAEFPISIGAGAGYHTLYDFGENYYFSSEDGGAETEKTLKVHGGMNLISPSLSLGFFNKVFAGITVNLSVLGEIYAEEDDGEDVTDSEKFTGSCTYAIIGVLARPIERLSVGLSYWPQYEWKFGGGDYITIPRMVALGLSWRITDQAVAGIEAQTRLYKELTTRVEGEMGSGAAVRAGGEYDFGTVAVRLGGFGETVPIGDYNYDQGTELDDPTFAFGATAGAGVTIKMVMLDFAIAWTRYAREETKTSDAGSLATYNYSENHFRFDAGATVNLPGIGFLKKDELKPVVQDTIMPEPIPEPERRKPIY